MNLTNVDTPASAMDAANRLYVDQEIAKALANMDSALRAQRNQADLWW